MVIYPKSKKRLGQVFLINERVAEAEAVHCKGKNVLEIGPGRGMLTRKLCENAKHVVAVEYDAELCEMLHSTMQYDNLKLINGDFFRLKGNVAADYGIEIMISNVPYNLSSKTVEWLMEKQMQAVLCLQKEFVGHMLARAGSHNYSRLSVMSALQFRITKIMDVKRGNFRPVPRVDSAIIYLKPLKSTVSAGESGMINLLMQHKKKPLRNAFIDSRRQMGLRKQRAYELAGKLQSCNSRVFTMEPAEILAAARQAMVMLLQKE